VKLIKVNTIYYINHIFIHNKKKECAIFFIILFLRGFNMVRLSIIMPIYNASNYLENALHSILSQNIDDIEIICINDGSTDNSQNILEKFSKQYDYLKVFNQENHGPAYSRNRGIVEAKGEYLAFLDADDIYLDNNALNHMFNIAIRNDADMVSANLRRIKQNGQVDENYDNDKMLYAYFDTESVINSYDYGIPWAFYKNIYKRDFIIKNNITFPDLIAGEDPIFLANVLTNIDKIFTVDVDLYGYNHSVGGGLNLKLNSYLKKKDYITHYLETFKILEKKGFENVLSDYKKEFIDYLNFRQNIHDSDIKKIIKELFVGDVYFNDNEYGNLIIDLFKNEINDNETDYSFIKYCLFEESMLENTFIDIDRLNEFIKISENKDLNSIKASFVQLKEIETSTFEEKRRINGTIDKLKIDISSYVKSNNRILTSNSWKLTSLLRNLKHKL